MATVTDNGNVESAPYFPPPGVNIVAPSGFLNLMYFKHVPAMNVTALFYMVCVVFIYVVNLRNIRRIALRTSLIVRLGLLPLMAPCLIDGIVDCATGSDPMRLNIGAVIFLLVVFAIINVWGALYVFFYRQVYIMPSVPAKLIKSTRLDGYRTIPREAAESLSLSEFGRSSMPTPPPFTVNDDDDDDDDDETGRRRKTKTAAAADDDVSMLDDLVDFVMQQQNNYNLLNVYLFTNVIWGLVAHNMCLMATAISRIISYYDYNVDRNVDALYACLVSCITLGPFLPYDYWTYPTYSHSIFFHYVSYTVYAFGLMSEFTIFIKTAGFVNLVYFTGCAGLLAMKVVAGMMYRNRRYHTLLEHVPRQTKY